MAGRTNATQSRASLAYGPGHSAFVIVPHDTNHLQQNSEDVTLRAIYVGGLGNVTGRVFTESGLPVTVTFSNVPAGSTLHFAFIEVHATLTTATLMLGLL